MDSKTAPQVSELAAPNPSEETRKVKVVKRVIVTSKQKKKNTAATTVATFNSDCVTAAPHPHATEVEGARGGNAEADAPLAATTATAKKKRVVQIVKRIVKKSSAPANKSKKDNTEKNEEGNTTSALRWSSNTSPQPAASSSLLIGEEEGQRRHHIEGPLALLPPSALFLLPAAHRTTSVVTAVTSQQQQQRVEFAPPVTSPLSDDDDKEEGAEARVGVLLSPVPNYPINTFTTVTLLRPTTEAGTSVASPTSVSFPMSTSLLVTAHDNGIRIFKAVRSNNESEGNGCGEGEASNNRNKRRRRRRGDVESRVGDDEDGCSSRRSFLHSHRSSSFSSSAVLSSTAASSAAATTASSFRRSQLQQQPTSVNDRIKGFVSASLGVGSSNTTKNENANSHHGNQSAAAAATAGSAPSSSTLFGGVGAAIVSGSSALFSNVLSNTVATVAVDYSHRRQREEGKGGETEADHLIRKWRHRKEAEERRAAEKIRRREAVEDMIRAKRSEIRREKLAIARTEWESAKALRRAQRAAKREAKRKTLVAPTKGAAASSVGAASPPPQQLKQQAQAVSASVSKNGSSNDAVVSGSNAGGFLSAAVAQYVPPSVLASTSNAAATLGAASSAAVGSLWGNLWGSRAASPSTDHASPPKNVPTALGTVSQKQQQPLPKRTITSDSPSPSSPEADAIAVAEEIDSDHTTTSSSSSAADASGDDSDRSPSSFSSSSTSSVFNEEDFSFDADDEELCRAFVFEYYGKEVEESDGDENSFGTDGEYDSDGGSSYSSFYSSASATASSYFYSDSDSNCYGEEERDIASFSSDRRGGSVAPSSSSVRGRERKHEKRMNSSRRRGLRGGQRDVRGTSTYSQIVHRNDAALTCSYKIAALSVEASAEAAHATSSANDNNSYGIANVVAVASRGGDGGWAAKRASALGIADTLAFEMSGGAHCVSLVWVGPDVNGADDEGNPDDNPKGTGVGAATVNNSSSVPSSIAARFLPSFATPSSSSPHPSHSSASPISQGGRQQHSKKEDTSNNKQTIFSFQIPCAVPKRKPPSAFAQPSSSSSSSSTAARVAGFYKITALSLHTVKAPVGPIITEPMAAADVQSRRAVSQKQFHAAVVEDIERNYTASSTAKVTAPASTTVHEYDDVDNENDWDRREGGGSAAASPSPARGNRIATTSSGSGSGSVSAAAAKTFSAVASSLSQALQQHQSHPTDVRGPSSPSFPSSKLQQQQKQSVVRVIAAVGDAGGGVMLCEGRRTFVINPSAEPISIPTHRGNNSSTISSSAASEASLRFVSALRPVTDVAVGSFAPDNSFPVFVSTASMATANASAIGTQEKRLEKNEGDPSWLLSTTIIVHRITVAPFAPISEATILSTAIISHADRPIPRGIPSSAPPCGGGSGEKLLSVYGNKATKSEFIFAADDNDRLHRQRLGLLLAPLALAPLHGIRRVALAWPRLALLTCDETTGAPSSLEQLHIHGDTDEGEWIREVCPLPVPVPSPPPSTAPTPISSFSALLLVRTADGSVLLVGLSERLRREEAEKAKEDADRDRLEAWLGGSTSSSSSSSSDEENAEEEEKEENEGVKEEGMASGDDSEGKSASKKDQKKKDTATTTNDEEQVHIKPSASPPPLPHLAAGASPSPLVATVIQIVFNARAHYAAQWLRVRRDMARRGLLVSPHQQLTTTATATSETPIANTEAKGGEEEEDRWLYQCHMAVLETMPKAMAFDAESGCALLQTGEALNHIVRVPLRPFHHNINKAAEPEIDQKRKQQTSRRPLSCGDTQDDNGIASSEVIVVGDCVEEEEEVVGSDQQILSPRHHQTVELTRRNLERIQRRNGHTTGDGSVITAASDTTSSNIGGTSRSNPKITTTVGLVKDVVVESPAEARSRREQQRALVAARAKALSSEAEAAAAVNRRGRGGKGNGDENGNETNEEDQNKAASSQLSALLRSQLRLNALLSSLQLSEEPAGRTATEVSERRAFFALCDLAEKGAAEAEKTAAARVEAESAAARQQRWATHQNTNNTNGSFVSNSRSATPPPPPQSGDEEEGQQRSRPISPPPRPPNGSGAATTGGFSFVHDHMRLMRFSALFMAKYDLIALQPPAENPMLVAVPADCGLEKEEEGEGAVTSKESATTIAVSSSGRQRPPQRRPHPASGGSNALLPSSSSAGVTTTPALTTSYCGTLCPRILFGSRAHRRRIRRLQEADRIRFEFEDVKCFYQSRIAAIDGEDIVVICENWRRVAMPLSKAQQQSLEEKREHRRQQQLQLQSEADGGRTEKSAAMSAITDAIAAFATAVDSGAPSSELTTTTTSAFVSKANKNRAAASEVSIQGGGSKEKNKNASLSPPPPPPAVAQAVVYQWVPHSTVRFQTEVDGRATDWDDINRATLTPVAVPPPYVSWEWRRDDPLLAMAAGGSTSTVTLFSPRSHHHHLRGSPMPPRTPPPAATPSSPTPSPFGSGKKHGGGKYAIPIETLFSKYAFGFGGSGNDNEKNGRKKMPTSSSTSKIASPPPEGRPLASSQTPSPLPAGGAVGTTVTAASPIGAAIASFLPSMKLFGGSTAAATAAATSEGPSNEAEGAKEEGNEESSSSSSVHPLLSPTSAKNASEQSQKEKEEKKEEEDVVDEEALLLSSVLLESERQFDTPHHRQWRASSWRYAAMFPTSDPSPISDLFWSERPEPIASSSKATSTTMTSAAVPSPISSSAAASATQQQQQQQPFNVRRRWLFRTRTLLGRARQRELLTAEMNAKLQELQSAFEGIAENETNANDEGDSDCERDDNNDITCKSNAQQSHPHPPNDPSQLLAGGGVGDDQKTTSSHDDTLTSSEGEYDEESSDDSGEEGEEDEEAEEEEDSSSSEEEEEDPPVSEGNESQ